MKTTTARSKTTKIQFRVTGYNSAILLSLANTAISPEMRTTLIVNSRGVTVRLGKFVVCRNASPATLEADYERGMSALKDKLGIAC